ncbi:MAG: efflux RND transporter periplasmic adaptor subunit, partial [Gallionella sp.]
MNKLFRSPLVLIIISVSVISIGIGIYWQFYKIEPPQYRTQPVEKGDISQTVSANGTINPVTLVSVGTQVSGTVKKLYVDFNSKVEKGQILLELDDALLAAQQKQSAANVQNAEASLELATANEARMRTLFAQEYVSRQELDSAVQAKKSAEAQLKLTQATVEKDRANLAYSVIRSPVSGVVVDRSVDVGQTVAASLQTPTLFKIAQDLS